MRPPPYFFKIQRDAQELWQKLQDPVLAAPWHQLFRQVQSPDHVVSELLQNADDAGAKRASVRLDDGYFIFEHDGADFTAEQFESLCRFGFSNKRILHTIGFRGVGFKSTFSLGDRVEVVTPSLSVAFNKERFTEPEWSNGASPRRKTRIRVKVHGRAQSKKLEQNLAKWIASPAALLFFNNVEELSINGRTVRREILRTGPVAGSEWVCLTGAGRADQLLLVRSKAEAFPVEAIEEIRSERHVEELHLPPCQVDLVLGLHGTQRLFVVLPTSAELPLPFSANAPFIQDPARFAIKDPSISATNRWLLARIGSLAGDTIRAWLGDRSSSLQNRARAYDLLATELEFDSTLSGSCGEMISEQIYSVLEGRPIALTTTGVLSSPGNCLAVPTALHNVWAQSELLRLFGTGQAHVLAAEVSTQAASILANKGWLEKIDGSDAITRLSVDPNPVRPESWAQLDVLWRFVQEEVKFDWNNEKRRSLRIVPVAGERVLLAANSVSRLSSRREAMSEADWRFITDHAFAIDTGWIQSLSARNKAESEPSPALTLLQQLALHEPTPVDRIVARASEKLFRPGVKVADCIRIAQIVAALGAKVPSGFQYVTKDLVLRDVTHGNVVDDCGEIEQIVPESWAQEHILDEDYTSNFSSCKRDTWRAWVRAEGSGLDVSLPMRQKQTKLWSRRSVEKFVENRGATKPTDYHYKRDDFTLVDFGFDQELVQYWAERAKFDPEIWAKVVELLLLAPEHAWKGKFEAEIRHNGTQYFRTLSCGTIPAEWLVRLRGEPCLFDTSGGIHTPAELLLRTPDTEPLIGIEPFVRADLDTERNKPFLRQLGVRDTPLGSDRIIDRIRAHSKMPQPDRFLGEITRLYQALDRVASRSTPVHMQKIAETFLHEPLILTHSLEWLTSGEATIFPEGEGPSTAIHDGFRRLSLWPRMGVADRPAIEQTLGWLRSLTSGSKLDAASLRRVRLILGREPNRVLESCGHWLSLDLTWEPIAQLQYRLTMQGLMKWGELAPFIKQRTANLQMITADIALLPEFSQLRELTDVVELRVTRRTDDPNRPALVPDWVKELAINLCRSEFSDDGDTARVRAVAHRLYVTRWQPVSTLEVTPYVDGVPAGEVSRPKVFWGDTEFLMGNFSSARLHKELVEELSRPFGLSVITATIAACADRSASFVQEYMTSEFKIDGTLSLPRSAPSVRSNEQYNDPVDNNSSSTADDQQSELKVADQPDLAHDPTNTGSEQDEEESPLPNSTPRKPGPVQQSLIGRYALARGFRPDKNGKRFFHANGSCIQRGEKPFNWEECAADGNLISRLAVHEHDLATGIQIAAELWLLVKESPAISRLVVLDGHDQPLAFEGGQLMQLHRAGKLNLYPSQYRIVHQPE